jgi:hypothetical protein
VNHASGAKAQFLLRFDVAADGSLALTTRAATHKAYLRDGLWVILNLMDLM